MKDNNHIRRFNESTENLNIPNDIIDKLNSMLNIYKEYRLKGVNKYKSAELSVNETFNDKPIKPYIHKDQYNDASHIFIQNFVVFFDGDIFKKI